MQKVRANIEITFEREDTLPNRNIVEHLKNLISTHLHERLSLINIDSIQVNNINELHTDKDVNREAENLIKVMDQNTSMLWTPDFKNKVEVIIVNRTEFIDDDGGEYNFDGINIEKLNLEDALKIDKDYNSDGNL